jgi:hypothetical protein
MRRHRSRTRHSLFPPPPPPPQSVTLQSKQFAPTHIHPPPSVRGSTLAIVCQAPHEQSRSSSTQSNQTLLLDTELSCKSEDNYIVRSHRHTLITHSIETYRWGRPGVPPRHHSLIEPSLSLASSHHQQGTTSGQLSGQLPKLEPRLLGEVSSECLQAHPILHHAGASHPRLAANNNNKTSDLSSLPRWGGWVDGWT